MELKKWAEAWPALHGAPPDLIRTSGGLVRLTIEGPSNAIVMLRADLLAAERWRTLTPSDADINTWLSEGSK